MDYLIYLDNPRMLVDIAPDDGVGALGSGWQIAQSEEVARALLTDFLARGYRRGHETAPRF